LTLIFSFDIKSLGKAQKLQGKTRGQQKARALKKRGQNQEFLAMREISR